MQVFSRANKPVSRRISQGGFTIVELLIVVVVIAVLAAVVIVAYNGISQQAKVSARAQDIAQLKRKAELRKVEKGITYPENYVFVYGNAVLGTSDFCVMKYEAKIQGNDVGTTTYASSMVAESRASGTPWVNISQSQAITEATAIGGHLITEAEWMTIAADVLSVKYNWSGGAVGSGYVYQGHVNDGPGYAIAASDDDTDGLFGITGGVGSGSGSNSQLTLLLSSGDTIWDFSGNVWERTQQAIGDPSLTVSQIGVVGDTGFNWRDYTLDSLSLGNLPVGSRPIALASIEVLSGAPGWNREQGIGRVYANYADTGVRTFRRGGAWTNISNAGVLSLALTDTIPYVDPTVGFRIAR